MPNVSLYCALDARDRATVERLAGLLAPAVGGLKLGLEYFCAHGPEGVSAVRAVGRPLFLDLKLHDIPNQVAGATARAAELGVTFLTVHAMGGRDMLAAAAGAAAAATGSLGLLGVTVLTSLDEYGLGAVFGRGVEDAGREADRLAGLVCDAGLAGVVCSAAEAARVRATVGAGRAIVTPGIRLAGDAVHDQRRVRTAGQAFRSGASHIVVGRPVTGAADPAAAFARIVADASDAVGGR